MNLTRGFKRPYVINEVDTDGNPVAPQAGDFATVVSGNTTIANPVADATPVAGSLGSGFIEGAGVGTTNVIMAGFTVVGTPIGVPAVTEFNVSEPVVGAAGIVVTFGDEIPI